MSHPIQLYWHTARHLKPVQIWRRMWRPRPVVRRSVLLAARAREGEWAEPIKHANPWLGGRRWRHLNHEREVRSWDDEDIEKLWLYHLHYLEHPCAETVMNWIEDNPIGKGSGWEPYPLSRRISNVTAWLIAQVPETDFRIRTEESLIAQADWLSQQVEWHLLGNHVLANAKALVMAGAYFSGPAANSWLTQGTAILRRELNEQILKDGGHFELSPMYHALLLEDILDLINTSAIYPKVLRQEANEWRRIAGRMLGWLLQLTHSDGQLPYFNDSVQGIAAETEDLRLYASRLGVSEESVSLGASGYIRLEAKDTVVIMDAGPIGPSYQPGHGHCDLLSLEVSHGNRQVITNSGVSTYEPGPLRSAERGTAAHNTVRVDNAEQSEIWSSFRVARRARVLESATDNRTWAEGAHDGYRLLRGNVIHRRRVEVSSGNVKVTDRLEGKGYHQAEVFWHPALDASVEINFDLPLTRRERKGWWCAGFNQRVDRTSVVGCWQGRLPIDLVTRLHCT